jgi:hypothetical protein
MSNTNTPPQTSRNGSRWWSSKPVIAVGAALLGVLGSSIASRVNAGNHDSVAHTPSPRGVQHSPQTSDRSHRYGVALVDAEPNLFLRQLQTKLIGPYQASFVVRSVRATDSEPDRISVTLHGQNFPMEVGTRLVVPSPEDASCSITYLGIDSLPRNNPILREHPADLVLPFLVTCIARPAAK